MAGPIDQLVAVTITASGATPQVNGFGIPAILCYHTHNTDYIRTYTSLAGLVADGFATTEPAYLMATAILSQTPSPSSFKVIRGTSAITQTVTFTVTDTTVGDQIGYQCIGTDGVAVDMYITGTGVVNTDATSIAALTDATGVGTTASGAIVTSLNSGSHTVVYYQGVKGGTFIDNTPTASYATDLNNALTVDTNFYVVAGEHMDRTNIAAMAAWAETNKRLHAYTTCDTNAKTASSGIGATMKAAAYAYTFGQWNGKSINYGALALAAQRLTAAPGTDTWAYKTLAGVTVDALTASEITALGIETANGNRLNYYITVANVNITRYGICASGMYADIRRGIDALTSDIQVAVYNLLVTSPKLPFDPAGIAIVGNAVRGVLANYTATSTQPANLLRGDPGFAPQVFLPDISTISTADRGNRYLNGIRFTAYGQNAVQIVGISGAVNT